MATNKKNIKVRDLKPKKDTKGGAGVINGGVTTKSKTGGPVAATGGPVHQT